MVKSLSLPRSSKAVSGSQHLLQWQQFQKGRELGRHYPLSPKRRSESSSCTKSSGWMQEQECMHSMQKDRKGQAWVARACNPSYSGGSDQEDCGRFTPVQLHQSPFISSYVLDWKMKKCANNPTGFSILLKYQNPLCEWNALETTIHKID
jgi:hypothetical protein